MNIFKINIHDCLFNNEIESMIKHSKYTMNDIANVYCIVNIDYWRDGKTYSVVSLDQIVLMNNPCIYKYMYRVGWCDDYYGTSAYGLELPYNDEPMILIMFNDNNFIIGRYGSTEFGYQEYVYYLNNDYRVDEHILDDIKESDIPIHNMTILHNNIHSANDICTVLCNRKDDIISGNIPYMGDYMKYYIHINSESECDAIINKQDTLTESMDALTERINTLIKLMDTMINKLNVSSQ